MAQPTSSQSTYQEMIQVLSDLPIIMREARRQERMSLRALGRHLDLAASTLSRLERGEGGALDTVVTVLTWLDGRGVTPNLKKSESLTRLTDTIDPAPASRPLVTVHQSGRGYGKSHITAAQIQDVVNRTNASVVGRIESILYEDEPTYFDGDSVHRVEDGIIDWVDAPAAERGIVPDYILDKIPTPEETEPVRMHRPIGDPGALY